MRNILSNIIKLIYKFYLLYLKKNKLIDDGNYKKMSQNFKFNINFIQDLLQEISFIEFNSEYNVALAKILTQLILKPFFCMFFSQFLINNDTFLYLKLQILYNMSTQIAQW
ncbi:hypothetical protein TTHERM_000770839 (macronuclear) [Tetrahymena thermophila SB210]|uniref:Uncharacterized protein n=1 Tax=Tetrahymena thermophila (strain SB210) TaxID=312017 RepID=W7XKI9_TETTS|nr:hypothetical protein TTHERM_000770839 [Tetrahymena thermophila SB210]EWS74944.1 hypothetical protein TTHERM_000770839 [Tetrahymena thermophila SB210]|eukprot:XP_012652533.1 hypothetical protein TTHERM_000770839 [Tetrahymena thermophila SB210]